MIVLLIAGCATPAHRIKQNPEIFAAFPPEIQEKVRNGEIEVGFSKDMVYIARGRPDREYQRQTAEGVTDVWAYVDVDHWTEQQRVSGNFRYRDSEGRLRNAYDSAWVDVRHEREYEKVRVEFQKGIVTAIETVRQ